MADRMTSPVERDSMGPIEMSADLYGGARTQRSDFFTGGENISEPLIRTLAIEKDASARTKIGSRAMLYLA